MKELRVCTFASVLALGGAAFGQGSDLPGGDSPLIEALPFSDSGTTVGAGNEFAGGCGGPDGPDVYYAINPDDFGGDLSVEISTCGSSYASQVHVFDSISFVPFACSASGCTGPTQGAILNVTLVDGATNFIGVDGSAGASGAYVINVDEGVPPPPCDDTGLVIPKGAVPADEACGEDENGGCFVGPEAHQIVADGDALIGTITYDGTTREFDMYQIDLTTEGVATMTLNAPFPLLGAFIVQDVPGSGVCPDTTDGIPVAGIVGPSEPCGDPTILQSAVLGPGTHWFLITCDFSSQVLECGGGTNSYTMEVSVIPFEQCDSVDVPGGAVTEGEACVDGSPDTVNGGCNSDPPVFGDLDLGTAVHGNAWWDGETRDTDWYVINTDDPIETLALTMAIQAQYLHLSGVIVMNPGFEGSGSCVEGAIAGVAGGTFVPCELIEIDFEGFPAGVNWAFHAPAFFGGTAPIVTCAVGPSVTNEYVLSMDITGVEPPACPADLNGDNSVGFADLLVLLDAWGEGGPADLDDSGTVGFQDLLILLDAWGPCPA